MKNRSRSLTLLELSVVTALVAILALALAVSLRGVATESAIIAHDSQIHEASSRVYDALVGDLRNASFATITVSGTVDAQAGRPVITFVLITGVDSTARPARRRGRLPPPAAGRWLPPPEVRSGVLRGEDSDERGGAVGGAT